jgi:hypothetical protein
LRLYRLHLERWHLLQLFRLELFSFVFYEVAVWLLEVHQLAPQAVPMFLHEQIDATTWWRRMKR